MVVRGRTARGKNNSIILKIAADVKNVWGKAEVSDRRRCRLILTGGGTPGSDRRGAPVPEAPE